MGLGWNLKLQKHSKAAKRTGSGNRRPRFASWFCHLLTERLWKGFWPFSSGYEDSISTDHMQLMWSYMSYHNAERPTCDCPFLYHGSPPLYPFIPLAYTHAVCGGSLEKESLIQHPPSFDLIPFLSFTSKLLGRIVHLLFDPLQSNTYLCYSNETVHQNHHDLHFV